MADAILTLNAGSSSIKFSLFEKKAADVLALRLTGKVEKILTEPHFVARDRDGRLLAERVWPGSMQFESLIEAVIAWVESHLSPDLLVGVGHRVVHGGRDYYTPELVTPALLDALDRLTPLAPLHEPHNVDLIRAIGAVRANLPQVACFDTAFHHGMPAVATRFALPRQYEEAGVRRYGFHGLSYEYIAGRLEEVAPDIARGRVIAAHLGNGASLCALNNRASVDTTMGFTALDGLVMGTRCGTIDPGVVLYLQNEYGLSPKAVEGILYNQSGLLGVSGGVSSDMRTLLASRDPRAREAVELFVYRIVREIGGLAGILDGLDALVFTAGIGENSPEIRAMTCARLGWLGVVLDASANANNATRISTAASRTAVYVIPTNEELMIGRHTAAVIGSMA